MTFIAQRSDCRRKRRISASLSDRDRIEYSCQKQDYSFLNYLAYVLYSPLYLAGPIITFNYYISQVLPFIYFYLLQLRYPASTISTRRTILYGLRFIFALLTMEIILHYMYVVAISKTRAWEGSSPFQLSMISFFNLQIIWLKVTVSSSKAYSSCFCHGDSSDCGQWRMVLKHQKTCSVV